ncbi:MAG TPA: IS3 family transposase, partial [Nitrospiria bacterium]|nr:IS3 family transposase [Nitrospiria bacterium]
MRTMALEAIYPKPRTTCANPEHVIYPYLLREVTVDAPNQVWCSDITYLPMHRGFMYLVAVMDWYSRLILSWDISNSLNGDFCITTLENAFAKYGAPDIFNTDQGSQFTSRKFTECVRQSGARISMDGKGRAIDNVFIERFWRSVKYEDIYLRCYQNCGDLYSGLERYMDKYNLRRPHQGLDGQTPEETYHAEDF